MMEMDETVAGSLPPGATVISASYQRSVRVHIRLDDVNGCRKAVLSDMTPVAAALVAF